MSNWYTSERTITLYDKQSMRVASIKQHGYTNNRTYLLTIAARTLLNYDNKFYFDTLKHAKEAGKDWVEDGLKPIGGNQ